MKRLSALLSRHLLSFKSNLDIRCYFFTHKALWICQHWERPLQVHRQTQANQWDADW